MEGGDFVFGTNKKLTQFLRINGKKRKNIWEKEARMLHQWSY
jgi:hypothetical protein